MQPPAPQPEACGLEWSSQKHGGDYCPDCGTCWGSPLPAADPEDTSQAIGGFDVVLGNTRSEPLTFGEVWSSQTEKDRRFVEKALSFSFRYATPREDLKKAIQRILTTPRADNKGPTFGTSVADALLPYAKEPAMPQTAHVVEVKETKQVGAVGGILRYASSPGMFQVVGMSPDSPVVHATYLYGQSDASRALAKLQAQAFLQGFLYAQNGATKPQP